VHPWDVERLSFAEIDAYIRALNDINREAAKAEREAKHTRG
jgi:hypothetical protein